jgi:RsiW-degrading membrane proteinase PrsW (M82 family)
MTDRWFHLSGGAPRGPVEAGELEALARDGRIERTTLVWKEGMADWRPAGELHASLFPAAEWFYVGPDGAQKGPVEEGRLAQLAREGALSARSPIWKAGMASWRPAAELPHLFPGGLPAGPPAPPGPPPPPPAPGHGSASRGVLRGIGVKISEYTDLPTISNVPIRDILVGGLGRPAAGEPLDVEEEFAVGTRRTTPALADVKAGWPTARVFWRILGGSVATYLLMRYGLTQFRNVNFFPGMVVVGSFVVPLSVVVLFFEMNIPRNVSVYQVGKMLLLGGALSLIATMFVFSFVPGSGTGSIIPAMLTGVAEETGKALALLILAYNARYRWQLNGLLFGAAVGAGFAGFESAGYAFRFGIDGGVERATDVIWIRGILAPGGHVIWTAMVGSAIWKVKGSGSFHPRMLVEGVVVRRWAIAVVLHGLWDTYIPLPMLIKYGALVVVGWYIVFAILKQALDEVAAAKAALSGAAAPST